MLFHMMSVSAQFNYGVDMSIYRHHFMC